MDVKVKLEENEGDMSVSQQTANGFNERKSQHACGIWTNDSRIADVDIKSESIDQTISGARNEEITDYAFIPNRGLVSQTMGVKTEILDTRVEGNMSNVHLKLDDSSITGPIHQIANAVDFNPMSYNIKGHFYVNASKRRPFANCDKVGVDFDVGSGTKHKLDLKLLTNGVMIEISDLAKDICSMQNVISDILEYNFDLCIPGNQRSEFSNRTYQRVKYLMKMSKAKKQNPEMLKQHFELPMTMMAAKTCHALSKHSNEIHQLVIKEEEYCVPLALEDSVSVECGVAQQDISRMNLDHDASQVARYQHVKETIANETDVPQIAFYTVTPLLINGPLYILIQDKPHIDLISSQHVQMETSSTDTNVSQSHVEAGQKPRDQSFMTPQPEDGTNNLYPLCKKIGLDLDANLNVKTKEKLDLSLLTKGAMIEVSLFAKKLCGTYRQIFTEVLEHNFNIDLHNPKDVFQNIIDSLRLIEKKTRPNLKGLLSEAKLELLSETFTIRLPKKRKRKVSSVDIGVTSESVVLKEQRLKTVTKRRRLDLIKKKEKKLTSERVTLMGKAGCVKTRWAIPERDARQLADKNAIFRNESQSTDLCIKQEPGLDMVIHQDVKMETDITQLDVKAVQRGNRNQSLMLSTTEKTTKDLYPLCNKIGLELDVETLLGRTVKLDLHVLTKGVMYEVHTFVKKCKRFYTPSLYDILEYNFELPFQHWNTSPFSNNISGRVKRFAKKYERIPAVNYLRGHLSKKLFKIDVNRGKIKSTATQYVSIGRHKEKKMANQILQLSKITAFGQLFTQGKFNDLYPNCKDVGVNLNVGSGTKKKLDINLLTNAVMLEVSHFAKEMNRSHALVISEILEYNFDLGLQSDQRYEFAIRTMVKVKRLKGMAKLQRPHLATKVFDLPDPRSIPMSKMNLGLKSLNDLVSFTLRFKKCVESQQLVMKQKEQRVSVMPFQKNALVGYEKAQRDCDTSQVFRNDKEIISNETCGAKCETSGLRNGPMKYQPNMLLISPQHVKMVTIVIDPNVSWSEEGYNLERDQSFMTTKTKQVISDLYPLCQKIGLDLDVKAECLVKEKLDFNCLTRDVMLEVAHFASEMCGTYRQIVLAILQYNFDLDFQNVLDLADNVIHNIMTVDKQMLLRQWRSKGAKFKSEWLLKKFSMVPPRKKCCVTANVSKQPVNYRRMKKKIETSLAWKTFQKARQIAQTIKTESVLTETDATQFANDTAEFCNEDRSAEIKEEFQGQSEVMEKAFDWTNTQVNICYKYIFETLKCRKTNRSKLMTSKLKKCFDQNNFKQILAKCRSDVLPLTVDKHSDFTHTEKRMVSLVSQLLCGLHLIEGLSEQAKTSVLLWERMILGDKEVKHFITQNIGRADLESETVCLVKTVHNAVQQLWERDRNLFRSFLVSKGELDEVLLCPHSESRIDGLFHNAAGVYCIHDDIIKFSRDHEDDSSVLAAAAVKMEVQPFKAGCRALGLISKQIIDPLLRALTLEDKALDMKVRYQTLVAKIKEWQEDGRGLVEGNVCLFDDIEVSKGHVFDKLTMWTDPNLFQLTVQIVELLLASFLIVCLNTLPVDLQQISRMDDRCRKDLEIIEQLQKAKANSISIAVEGMGMCKTNHTWEWLSSLDAFKIVSVLKALEIV